MFKPTVTYDLSPSKGVYGLEVKPTYDLPPKASFTLDAIVLWSYKLLCPQTKCHSCSHRLIPRPPIMYI